MVAARQPNTEVFFPSGAPWDVYEWIIRPLTDPSPDGYFWSHQLAVCNSSLVNLAGGYAGMQTVGSGVGGKAVLFSLAGSNVLDGNVLATSRPYVSSNDFDGGPGWSTRIRYDWVTGRSYKFRLAKDRLDGTGRWWKFSITDVAAATTLDVSEICLVSTADGFSGYSVCWTERYSGATATCDDLRLATAEFKDFTADGNSPASFNNIMAPVAPPLCDSTVISSISGGFRHSVGVATVTESGGTALPGVAIERNRAARMVGFPSPSSVASPVALNGARDLSYSEVHNDLGSGSLTIQNDNTADAAYVTRGSLIRAELYVPEDDAYEPAGLWRVEGTNKKWVQNTRDARVTTVSGRTVACDFERSLVYPNGGVGKVPWSSERHFDWAAPELDTTSWAAANIRHIQGVRDGTDGDPPYGLNGFPWSWPNPLTYWLWGQAPTLNLYASGQYGDPAGVNYFQYRFTTSTELDVTFYVTADDLFVAALDGCPIIDFTTREGDVTIAADSTWWRKMRIPAGSHTFSVKAENLSRPGMTTNGGLINVVATYNISPATTTSPWGTKESFKFLFSTVGVAVNSPQLATQTQAWKALPYPSQPPGLTGGEIIDVLVSEAQDRGELAGWSVVDMTTAQIPDFVVPVGSTILDVLNRLVSDGWIDWWVSKTDLVLFVSAQGAKGGSFPTAVFTEGTNVTAYEQDERWGQLRDKMLVAWNNGYLEIGNTSGAAGAFISLGDAVDAAEATRRATANLNKMDDDSVGVVAAVEPLTRAQMPLVDWVTGYSPTLTIDDLGTDTPIATTLGFQEANPTGQLAWTTQFLTRRRYAEELASRLALRAVPGALGGRTDSVVPAAPNQPAGGALELYEFTFNLPGRADTADEAAVAEGFTQQTSGFERTKNRLRIQRATLEASEASTGDAIVDVYINNSWAMTLALQGGSALEVYDYFGSQVVWPGNSIDNWFLEVGVEDKIQARLRNGPGDQRNLTLRLYGALIP